MSRLTLRGKSLDALQTQVRDEYGAAARIVSAERVTLGGIGGVLARKYFEVIVDLPEGELAPRRPAHRGIDNGGLSALLAAADAEDAVPESVAASQRSRPTPPADFDTVLALVASTAGLVPPHPASTIDAVGLAGTDFTGRTGHSTRTALEAAASTEADAGDLILVVGIGQDALAVATALAQPASPRSAPAPADPSWFAPQAHVRAGGTLICAGWESITDRRSALGARAAAVMEGLPVFVAFGLCPNPQTGVDLAAATSLALIGADRVIAVVDVSRKPQDTERWVTALRRSVSVDVLAVVGSELTATPHTVSVLGVPVGSVHP